MRSIMMHLFAALSCLILSMLSVQAAGESYFEVADPSGPNGQGMQCNEYVQLAWNLSALPAAALSQSAYYDVYLMQSGSPVLELQPPFPMMPSGEDYEASSRTTYYPWNEPLIVPGLPYQLRIRLLNATMAPIEGGQGVSAPFAFPVCPDLTPVEDDCQARTVTTTQTLLLVEPILLSSVLVSLLDPK